MAGASALAKMVLLSITTSPRGTKLNPVGGKCTTHPRDYDSNADLRDRGIPQPLLLPACRSHPHFQTTSVSPGLPSIQSAIYNSISEHCTQGYKSKQMDEISVFKPREHSRGKHSTCTEVLHTSVLMASSRSHVPPMRSL